jgi:hypothetical protein
VAVIGHEAVILDDERVQKSDLRALFTTIENYLSRLEVAVRDAEDGMAAYTTMGVLGEATTASTGTTTVLTLGAGRGGVGQFMLRGVAAATSKLALIVNGVTVAETGSLSAGQIIYSSASQMFNTVAAATAIDGTTDDNVVAPGPQKFYIDAADTVQYTVSGANFTSLNVQFVGGHSAKS